MRKSTIIKKIEKLQGDKKDLIDGLLHSSDMIRGSYHKSYTKCGKLNCKCLTGKGHLCRKISWTQDAKSKTKSINEQHEEWAKACTQNYKMFRKNRQKLKSIDQEMKVLLDLLEESIVSFTWSNRADITPPK